MVFNQQDKVLAEEPEIIPNKITLTGKVVDSDNNGVSGVIVELIGYGIEPLNPITSTPTQTTGEFEFIVYEGQSYSLHVTDNNYKSITVAADLENENVITVEVKDTQTLSFSESIISKKYGDDKFTNTIDVSCATGTGTIAYTCSNTSVATVTMTTGEVTIIGVGEATITATKEMDDNTFSTSSSYVLNVAKKSESIKYLVTSKDIIYERNKKVINELDRPANIDGNIIYTSSNTAVATVNTLTGEVTVRRVGTSIITATLTNDSLYEDTATTYNLRVKKIADALNYENSVINKTYGDAKFINESLKPEGTDGDISYTTSNSGVATIDPHSGEVTIVGAGTTIITAILSNDSTYEDAQATYTLNVAKKANALNYSTITFEKTYGDNTFINNTLSKSPNNIIGEITYVSSDNTVATVDSVTGQITILSAGTATITASMSEESNYEEDVAIFNVNVSKKDIKVKLNGSKAYGQENPNFKSILKSLIKDQLVNNDDIEEIASHILISCDALTYTEKETSINLSSTVHPNYNFGLTNGSLIITRDYSATENKEYIVTGVNSDGWAKETVTISISNDIAYDGYTISKFSDRDWTNSITYTENEAKTVHLFYIRKADGSVSIAASKEFGIDLINPEIIGITFKGKTLGELESTLNFLSFGIFFNEEVIMTVNVRDGSPSSGYRIATLYGNGVEIATASIDASNQAEFNIPSIFIADDNGVSFNKELSVMVTDIAGNESVVTKPSEVNSNIYNNNLVLENKAADITNTREIEVPTYQETGSLTKDWYEKDISFDISVNDLGSGIRSVEIKINNTILVKDDFRASLIGTKQYTVNTANAEDYDDGSFIVLVTVVDNAGNKSEKTDVIYVDSILPEVVSVEFTDTNNNKLSEVLNFLTLGIFFNGETKVSVTATDLGKSGVFAITLNKGTVSEVKYTTDNKAVFSLPIGFSGELSIGVKDNVGNIMNKKPSEVSNSGIKNDKLILENIGPLIRIDSNNATYTDSKGKKWNATNNDFMVTVEDYDSGLRSASVSINGNQLAGNSEYYKENTKVVKMVYSVNTSGSTRNNDGSFFINVTSVDNAGNSSTSSDEVYKDDNKPTISSITFADANDKPLAKVINFLTFGVLFNQETRVTVVAADTSPSSGIKNITLIKGNKSEQLPVSNDRAVFTIAKGEKGFNEELSAYATDNVGNSNQDSPTKPSQVNKEITNNNLMIENIESTITITPDRVPDANEKWYRSNVTLTVKVSDVGELISGLRSVKIYVNGKQYGDTHEYNTSATKTEEATYTVVLDDKWINDLINEDGAYAITVETVDNAGNETSNKENPTTVYIDLVAPLLEDLVGAEEGSFNTGNKIITVKSHEKHFDQEGNKVTFEATRTLDGKTESYNMGDFISDKVDSSYTHNFKQEGTYKIIVKAVDAAGNEAEQKTMNFTIDNIKPIILISGAEQNVYSDSDINILVSVTESNFSNNKVTIDVKKNLDGITSDYNFGLLKNNAKLSQLGNTFNQDGTYTITVNALDASGNKADTKTLIFTVDKTNPTILIKGIPSKINGEGTIVAPEIIYDDIYFESMVTTLTRANKGSTEKLIYTDKTNAKGGIRAYDNFPDGTRTNNNDDIYTLYVKVVDKAGRSTEQIETFSVNRFGSVYSFSSGLSNLIGNAYVKEVSEDIIISETNANLLVDSKIVVTKDGTILESVTYSTEKSGGVDKWYNYKYNISKSNFEEDGVYQIFVSSKDDAGNNPENINFEDKAILFRVDSTTPEITNITDLEKKSYNANSITVNFTVFDRIGLAKVTAYVNNKSAAEFATFEDKNEFSGSFEITEGANQSIRIVVEDLTGNITDSNAENFDSAFVFNKNITVSTSFWVRFRANDTMFFYSIIGISILAIGLLTFIFIKKRHKVK
jgi:hypothetical protein